MNRLLRGRSAEEAAAILPRLFALCREAQGQAARLALGLPEPPGAPARLVAEVVRDHAIKLMVTLPPHLGLPARALPPLGGLPEALFGPGLPTDPCSFKRWIAADRGCAGLVAATGAAFLPGEAAPPALPAPSPGTALLPLALENSPAMRVADDPVMRHIEGRWGRGPLWRVWGLMLDAARALAGGLPAPHLRRGAALVPAARGLYALRIETEGGRVASVLRMTPTDHMTAPGGALDRARARLRDRALAPFVEALFDPCVAPGGVGHA